MWCFEFFVALSRLVSSAHGVAGGSVGGALLVGRWGARVFLFTNKHTPKTLSTSFGDSQYSSGHQFDRPGRAEHLVPPLSLGG